MVEMCMEKVGPAGCYFEALFSAHGSTTFETFINFTKPATALIRQIEPCQRLTDRIHYNQENQCNYGKRAQFK